MAPELSPFIISLFILAGLLLLEIIGALLGASPSSMVEHALPGLDAPDVDLPDLDASFDLSPEAGLDGTTTDLDASGFAGALSWLHFGRLPLLVILALFLGSFGGLGWVGQNTWHDAFGGYLPLLVAAPLAFIAAVFATRILGRALLRIWPTEMTTAVKPSAFVGSIATIQIGRATHEGAAEARVVDRHGREHFIMVQARDPDMELHSGEDVLLTRRDPETGRFQAIPAAASRREDPSDNRFET